MATGIAQAVASQLQGGGNQQGQPVGKKYTFGGMELSPDQAKQLQLVNAMGQAGYLDNNDASKILYNTLLKPQDNYQEMMGYADALYQMGNTDAANSILGQVGRQLGFDPTTLGLGGMSPNMMGGPQEGMTPSTGLTQRFQRAMEMGDTAMAQRLQKENPDYSFMYDPQMGAQVNVKGGGLGQMLLGGNQYGATGDVALNKYIENVIGGSEANPLERALRFSGTVGSFGLLPMLEGAIRGGTGQYTKDVRDEMRRQKMREQEAAMLNQGF